MNPSIRMAGVAVLCTAGALVFACGGDDRDFGDGQPGVGGAEGGGKSGPTGGGDSVAGEGMTGGVGAQPTDAGAGGGAGVVGDAGAGGMGPEPTMTCPDGYSTWLTSSFAFPDGAIIGTADFPSLPWRPTGSLALDTGRLTGVGTAVVSQSGAFPYAGTRLRFRVRFSDASQQVTVAANAADDGAGGIRLSLAASGDLVLSEGASSRGQAAFDPLDTGVDWFVEAELDAATAHVTLASGAYGKQSSIVATIDTDALKQSAKGVKTAVRLDSEVGISAAVDEVSVARCGVEAPQYEAKMIDTFERPNSAALGKAQLPNVAWVAPAGSFQIIDGALQSKGDLKGASLPLSQALPLTGLRLRAAVRAVTGGDGPYLWADVNFNVAQGIHGIKDDGFWVWGGPNDAAFHTGIFPGGGEVKHTTKETGIYFAQLDRDGDAAVITVREQSFEGPILGVQFADALGAPANAGTFVTVGDEGGDGTRWEELRVDVFPVE